MGLFKPIDTTSRVRKQPTGTTNNRRDLGNIYDFAHDLSLSPYAYKDDVIVERTVGEYSTESSPEYEETLQELMLLIRMACRCINETCKAAIEDGYSIALDTHMDGHSGRFDVATIAMCDGIWPFDRARLYAGEDDGKPTTCVNFKTDYGFTLFLYETIVTIIESMPKYVGPQWWEETKRKCCYQGRQVDLSSRSREVITKVIENLNA